MSLNPAGNGDRELVERAVTLLRASLAPGWTHLHIECAPSGEVQAFWTGTAGTPAQPVNVPPQGVAPLHTYLARAATSGSQQLVVDVYPDGRLSARTEPAPGARPSPWIRYSLIGLSVACCAAAGAVFMFGWRWSAPPAADADLLPAPSPQQQQAFNVIDDWLGALDARDATAAQELSCRNPAGSVRNDIDALRGDYLGSVDHLEAIVDFRDNGPTMVAKVLLRVHPISDLQKKAVADNQRNGSGLANRTITLVNESGSWKVCDGA
ncbi:hypothetical protein ACXPWS_26930 [Mycobacterium sp. BMJ-28]